MKNSPLALIVGLLGLILAAGCKPAAGPGNTSDSKKPRIALVMGSLANEFFQHMAEGAKNDQATRATEYDLIVNGIKNATDIGEQSDLVDQMIAQGAQAIVIAPIDSEALIPALKRANAAGIVVINIDSKLDADALKKANLTVPFVGPDNREGAFQVGNVVASKLKPGDKVAIIEGIPTAFNGQQRLAGFQNAMKKGGLDVVSVQSGEWEMDKAETIASGMIIQHPDLKAILCANDNMALGAVAAVQAEGKTGRILIAGFDNISAIQTMVADGRVLVTADQHSDKLAVFGIDKALAILKGTDPGQDVKTPVDIIVKH